MRAMVLVALVVVGSPVIVVGDIVGNVCNGAVSQSWTFLPNGQLQNKNGQCLTAASIPRPSSGATLMLQDCSASPTPEQGWLSSGYPETRWGKNASIVLASNSKSCVNLESYATAPGSTVWVFNECTIQDCKNNCDWVHGNDGSLQNTESKLCLDNTPSPSPYRTCASSSISAKAPFCDTSLSFEQRAQLLVANLSLQEKLSTFMLTGMLKGIPRLNIKKFRWDATDIEGVDDQVFKFNNTCFPHAIALGATWDTALIAEVSQATAIEARILEQLYYNSSGGTTIGATSYDGGPLANVAYDPRVGRISEMYSECPYHASVMGTIATLALQNKTDPDTNGDFFLQTSQVTRHFITDHGSRPDNGAGDYWGDLSSLEDEFLPPFKAFQVDGQAEGIMFSISSLNGMSSVTNEYLFGKLRKEWNTTCLAQTDCCGTFNAAVSTHKNFNTTEDAVATAIKAGIQLDYGDSVGADITNALADGKLDRNTFDAAVERAFLTRFRLGEFDEAPRNPFFGSYDTSLLDGQAHRQLARKAAAASMVLLQNNGDVLPLSSTVKTIAVVGPFADCSSRAGGYGGHPCYLHSYNGQPSYISTILAAIEEEATAIGASVKYVRAADETGAPNSTGIAEAVAIATSSDVTVLALGLGSGVEGEGLDRSYLGFPDSQQALLDNITSALQPNQDQHKTILVINSAGGVDFDVTKVDAIVQAWYGGQETGHGVSDILWGRVSPVGRMPITVHPAAYLTTGVGPVPNLNMTFPAANGQGIQGRTYRYLSSQMKDAIFSFGWGLSYTQFHYSDISVSVTGASVNVSVTVANVGKVAGEEVAELYLTVPRTPESARSPPQYALQGFQKIMLAPGENVMLSFLLKPDQLSVVTAAGTRIVPSGEFTISVSGHLPSDPRATLKANAGHASNIETTTFSW